jgi:hypothetical protein
MSLFGGLFKKKAANNTGKTAVNPQQSANKTENLTSNNQGELPPGWITSISKNSNRIYTKCVTQKTRPPFESLSPSALIARNHLYRKILTKQPIKVFKSENKIGENDSIQDLYELYYMDPLFLAPPIRNVFPNNCKGTFSEDESCYQEKFFKLYDNLISEAFEKENYNLFKPKNAVTPPPAANITPHETRLGGSESAQYEKAVNKPPTRVEKTIPYEHYNGGSGTEPYTGGPGTEYVNKRPQEAGRKRTKKGSRRHSRSNKRKGRKSRRRH